MSHAFDERYDVYAELFPRARKAHTCSACKETICVGHRYARVCIIFDGSTETVKRCIRCQRIHEHLRSIAPGEMWPDERLDCGEEYEEHWGGPPPEEVARLAFLTADEAQALVTPETGGKA